MFMLCDAGHLAALAPAPRCTAHQPALAQPHSPKGHRTSTLASDTRSFSTRRAAHSVAEPVASRHPRSEGTVMTLEGLLHRVCFEAVRPTAVPDVRIRTHKELQTHSEEHQRVLSLLPSSVRSRLLSAGTLSSLQQSGARDTAQSSLSQAAAKGIVLTTHGREQARADCTARLAPALPGLKSRP
eukprot:4499055-Pleurochrysis_carterae.AAC.1